MTGDKFISYAQNREDVVLWRALSSVQDGVYVEIGANDPVTDSVTKAFYDRGWSGLTVEPDPAYARRLQETRPRDHVVEAAVCPADTTLVLHRVPNTGLSTVVAEVHERNLAQGHRPKDIEVRGVRLDALLAETGFAGKTVHFMVVDVEGAEPDVLASVDLRSFRPWVLVVEATEPNSTRSTRHAWEQAVLDAGYQLCLFDGVSCFYVAEEHAPTLGPLLSYPACVLDGFVDVATSELQARLGEAAKEARLWRAKALVEWATGVGDAPRVALLERQSDLMRRDLNKARKQVEAQAARIRKLRSRVKALQGGPDDTPQSGPRDALSKAARALGRRR